jgi:hypothetical protein
MAKKVTSKKQTVVTRSYVVISLTDVNGVREEREVPVGACLRDILPAGQVGYVNNQSVLGTTELKSGDEVLFVQPSAKGA